MADVTSAVLADLMYETRGPLQKNYPREHVLLAELSGIGEGGDGPAPRRITPANGSFESTLRGLYARIPLILSDLQGGGNASETGTLNVPQTPDTDQAQVSLARIVVPIGISLDAEQDSLGESAVQGVAMLMEMAFESHAWIANVEANGGGDALLANVSANTTSPSLTVYCAATDNWDLLTPGRIVDILTRANGADPGQGLARKIASVNESTGVITFETTSYGGGSGNITFANTSGIYIQGSYGLAMQGLDQAAAATGTFETIIKANVPGWQGTDGRAGDTTDVLLTDKILDQGVRRGRRSGRKRWDFAIGDPAVIDLYKESKYTQVQYSPDSATLKSGFQGIVYDGADGPIPLIKEPAHVKNALKFVPKSDLHFYAGSSGPDWVADDGSMWRRFARALPKEAWLLDRVQLGVHRCNTIVRFGDLRSS